jgi:hypothetical protein
MPDGFEPIGSATSVVPTVAASADDLSGAGRPASGRAGGSRDDQTTELMPSCLGVARLAVGSFLARYREPTLTAYTQDLRAFPGWRQTHDREPLRVTRGELEIYVRDLESRGYAAATVARRFGTVATFYKYAVNRRAHPSQPGGRGEPAQSGLGGTEAHRAAPAGVRRTAVRRPHL